MGAWVGAALTGLGALGGLFGKKKEESTTDYSSSTKPVYDPTNLGFRDYLINSYQSLLNGGGDFQRGYMNTGLNNINHGSQQAQQAISDLMTSRGLGHTTAGVGTLGDVSMSRANQTASFLNSIPLVMDNRQQSILGSAAGYQSSLPVGTSQSGTQHTVGTAGPSSPLAGLLGGASQGLAGWLGAYQANQNFGNFLKGIGKP